MDPELADLVIYDEEYIEAAFTRLESHPDGSPEYQAALAEAGSRHRRSQEPYALALREHQRALPDLIPKYEQMRQQLAECRNVDEAEHIRDMAQRLQVCARQLHDTEAETWLAEIKLRALRTIGEMSKELKKSPHGPGRGKRCIAGNTPFKNEVLKAAGISRMKASEAERVAHIPSVEFERHITRARKDNRPVHIKDLLRTVVRGRQLQSQKRPQDFAWRDSVTQIVGVIDGAPRPVGRIWQEAQSLSAEDVFKLILLLLAGDDFKSNGVGTDFNPYRQLLRRMLEGDGVIEAVLRGLSERTPDFHRHYLAGLMKRSDELEDLVMVDWTEATFGLTGREVQAEEEPRRRPATPEPVGERQQSDEDEDEE